ncbi:MAG: Hsp20/alpha crystallin family protein [Kiritimatiellae bacterium]|nr:Hsp20/alpha crystallin family protein [Kiritimatiellia bacterium]
MKDNNNSNKLTLLTTLVVVLLAAVVVQSIAMLGLRKELRRDIGEKASAPRAVASDDKGKSAGTPAPAKDLFARDPFDWNLDDWDPFKEMHSMHDRINQMFGNAYNRFQKSDGFGSFFGTHTFSPSVNIEDKGDRYLVTVDLPGAEESQLDINLDGEELTISGSVESEIRDEEDGKMLRQERRSGKFSRTIMLPGSVQADKMTSENKKGILYIEILKAKQER